MNHQETQSSGTYSIAIKTSREQTSRKSMPYGMADDPHAGARKSPCLDFYDFPSGLPCPVWVKRENGSLKVPGYGLPKECVECKRRIEYADSMDLMANKRALTSEHAKYLDTMAKQPPKGSKGAATAAAYSQAMAMGYPSYEEALRALYFDEELSTVRMGVLLGVSHSKVTMDLKRYGYKLRQGQGGQRKKP